MFIGETVFRFSSQNEDSSLVAIPVAVDSQAVPSPGAIAARTFSGWGRRRARSAILNAAACDASLPNIRYSSSGNGQYLIGRFRMVSNGAEMKLNDDQCYAAMASLCCDLLVD